MAYTPKTWTCGELITDAGLNNIEEGIQEALGCCGGGLPEVTTDDNGDVLTVVDGEWAKAEPGYKCTETSTTLTEESVTTARPDPSVPFAMGNFSYSSLIDADTITVTFNGTEYEVDKNGLGGGNAYGGIGSSGPDFSEYPFAIMSNFSGNFLYTENEGTYSVKIEAVSETVETSECFSKAIEKVASPLKYVKDNPTGNKGVIENLVAGVSVIGGDSQTHVATEATANKATGEFSHAEGGGYSYFDEAVPPFQFKGTTANGDSSHAEGSGTTASGARSHAEGFGTTASGDSSHAEGSGTTASGARSHAEGSGTTANHRAQHVFGEYNAEDPSTAPTTTRGTYVEIVGNGASNFNRSNARTLDWSGNEVIAGTLSQSSDRRLKEHIDYLGEDAEEFIRGLKPAHYIKDDRHHVGFYAQDVEELDKWDCMTGEMNGYKTLGYTEIIAPLVAYCQSLEKRIQELENK